jgi:hypothetical protein
MITAKYSNEKLNLKDFLNWFLGAIIDKYDRRYFYRYFGHLKKI